MSRFKKRDKAPVQSSGYDDTQGVQGALEEQETLISQERPVDQPQPDLPAVDPSPRATTPPEGSQKLVPQLSLSGDPPSKRASPHGATSQSRQVSRESSARDPTPRGQLNNTQSQSHLSVGSGQSHVEEEPRGRVQIVTPSASSRRNVPPLRLDSGLELPQINGNPDDESGQNMATVKPLQQDAQGQQDRMLRLRQLHESCCFSWVSATLQYCRMGYDTRSFLRLKSFEEANKGLDLRRDASAMNVSVIVQNIDTYKTHITGLIRPVVRLHTVSMESGLYIKGIGSSPPTPPICTKAELSSNSGSSAAWNQELVLDAHFYDIVSEDALLLFEILDEKPSLSLDKTIRAKQKYLKKVAWGYLLPVGTHGQMNVGFGNRHAMGGGHGAAAPVSARAGTARSHQPGQPAAPANRPFHHPIRVQLYHYRRYDGLVGVMQRNILAWPQLDPRYLSLDDPAYPNSIPSVYLQWKLLQKLPITGAFMNMSVGPKLVKVRTPRGEGDDNDGDTDGSMSPRSKLTLCEDLNQLYERLSRKKKKQLRSRDEANKLKSAALRRARKQEEACAIPDKFLRRLDVGPDGAMVVAFSHCGHLLAIAARYDTQSAPLFNQDLVYSLILYDTDTDEEVWSEYVAHHAVIYDIRWSKNDRYLLTCGGDGACKIWDLLYFCPLLDVIERSRSSTQAVVDNTMLNGTIPEEGPPGSPMTAAEHSPELTKNNILLTHPPRIIQILSIGTGMYAYCGIFQEFGGVNIINSLQLYNTLLGTANSHLMGLPTLQEQFTAIEKSTVPRVIIGCADGRMRVFDDQKFMGFICIAGSSEENGEQDFSPHDAQINSLVVDERSKYLVSGDANGDIFAWRLDRNGWYQLLRKFKRNPAPNSTGNPLFNAQTAMMENFDSGSVLTMLPHPIKSKSMLLVHSRQPATIKVISMTTYKPVSQCEGYSGIPQTYLVREDSNIFSAGVFFRAMFSADGRYIICCNTTNSASSVGSRSGGVEGAYKLLVWDTYTGHMVQTPLSSLTFPYPVRSISWHPCQHLLAITMVGDGAAVVLYSTDSDSSFKMIERKADIAETGTGVVPSESAASLRISRDRGPRTGIPSISSSDSRDDLNYSILDSSTFNRGKGPLARSGLDGTAQVLQGTLSTGSLEPPSTRHSPAPGPDQADRMLRAKELLEKVRQNRAK